MKALDRFEVWLVTGSQHLYGEEVLRQVAEQSRQVAAGLAAAAAIPVSVVHTPPVTSAESIRALLLEANAAEQCVGLIAWMHTFSPAKMWIAGLRALQKPLLHLHTQFNRELPWAEIDMDFMNLNQSAHGDREFGYLATRMRIRRKTVAGHWTGPERPRADRHLVEGGLRLARGAVAARRPLRRQHAPGRGHGRRQGRGADSPRRLRQRVRRRRARVGGRRRRRRERRPARLEYEDGVRARSRAGAGGEQRESLRDAARIEAGLRAFLEAGGFSAFTTTFEDLGGLRQLPGIAVQRLMADGYGFGAEGDWKTAALVRLTKVMSAGLDGRHLVHGGLHLPPRAGRSAGARRAHARGVPDDQRPASRAARSTRSRSGPRSDPVRLVFTAAPGPAVVVALLDLGNRFRLVANDVEVVEPDGGAAAAAGRASDLATHAELRNCGRGVARGRRPSPHELHAGARRWRRFSDFAEIAGIEIVVIDESTTVAALEAGAPLEPRLLPPGRGACSERWPTTPNCGSRCSRGTSSSSARGSSFSRSAT